MIQISIDCILDDLGVPLVVKPHLAQILIFRLLKIVFKLLFISVVNHVKLILSQSESLDLNSVIYKLDLFSFSRFNVVVLLCIVSVV